MSNLPADTAVLIPARYKSSRYPGKPLAPLTGRDGTKPLIQRTYEAALAVADPTQVFVATDDDRIAEAARAFGAQVVMTPESCANGTERCASALPDLPFTPEIVVNLQGDSPLTPPWFITDCEAALRDRPDMQVATPVLSCDAQTYANFRADRAEGRVGGTTAVFGVDHAALYFSKEVIPYLPDEAQENPPVWHHVGLYAYRPAALEAYTAMTPGQLEALEGLEQLRFLENGARVLCVPVEARGRHFWELNNPVDVERIESQL